MSYTEKTLQEDQLVSVAFAVLAPAKIKKHPRHFPDAAYICYTQSSGYGKDNSPG